MTGAVAADGGAAGSCLERRRSRSDGARRPHSSACSSIARGGSLDPVAMALPLTRPPRRTGTSRARDPTALRIMRRGAAPPHVRARRRALARSAAAPDRHAGCRPSDWPARGSPGGTTRSRRGDVHRPLSLRGGDTVEGPARGRGTGGRRSGSPTAPTRVHPAHHGPPRRARLETRFRRSAPRNVRANWRWVSSEYADPQSLRRVSTQTARALAP
jgi:hypothetical protein